MKIIKNTFLRVADGLYDAFKTMFGTACNLLSCIVVALVLNYVSAIVIGIIIVALLVLIVYYTYKEELDDIGETDD